MIKNSSKLSSDNYSIVPFLIVLSLYTCVTLWLFYNQSLHASRAEPFFSDHAFHAALALDSQNPSPALFDVIFANLNQITGLSHIVIFPIMLIIYNSGCILILRYWLRNRLLIDNFEKSTFFQYKIDFFSISLLLVSAILIPCLSIGTSQYNWYLLKFPPNPYHNPTYISCRFLALIVFILLFNAYDKFYENKKHSILYFVLLSVFSSLCMLAKPSFFLGFMPACVIVMFFELFITKFKSFAPSFFVGLSFLPALLIVLWQNFYYFGGDNQSHITFMPLGLVKYYNISIPHLILNILCGASFPLFMIFLCIKYKIFNLVTKIGFVNWLTSMFVSLFLVETGPRFKDGNMTWTALTGNFFAFVVGSQLLLKYKFSKKETIVAYSLYAIHIIFGIAYLIWLCCGNLYV